MAEGDSPTRRPPRAPRVAAFFRVPLTRVGLLVILIGVLGMLVDTVADRLIPGTVAGILAIVGVGLVLVGSAFSFLAPTDRGPAVLVDSPVEGRWQAVNSPASKVPSHSTHAYGQAYAVDLVFLPEGVEHPEFGKAGAAVLPPERFPAFGRPIHSCTDGVVVAASDRLRDHGSRSDWLALVWFVVAEAFVRELGGAGRVVGNHVIVRLDDGSHLVYAHLRHGSAHVAPGDRLTAGDLIAECGNTGNSTEPHLHVHRQDVASLALATGLPWAIRGAADDGGDGFPVNEATFEGHPAG